MFIYRFEMGSSILDAKMYRIGEVNKYASMCEEKNIFSFILMQLEWVFFNLVRNSFIYF